MPEDSSVQIETRTLGNGTAELRVGIARVNVTTIADRLHVEYRMGNTEDVLIFPVNGHLRVVRIRQVMTIQSPTPAVPAQTSITDQLENAPVEEEEAQRLLAIYHLFEGRSYSASESS